MINIEYKKLNKDVLPPNKAHDHDAGFDIFASHDDVIPAGESRTIQTGISINIPEGYAGFLFSRSGMGKHGLRLSNCVGVIDAGYQGEIGVMLHNDSSLYYPIRKFDKIAQLVIIPIVGNVDLTLVQEFIESARGKKGFGSTGR